ncbi:uncharacterized protein LOC128157523 [Crassostrea angulata]|uniref:uncharacterized protein LOC128157523 n=1 Tax=Magallana angulata TaxID=2784310 RepID=UPI0022B1E545|nr:uncharacterized protein LOC128157523 [Crassostrea angulata]
MPFPYFGNSQKQEYVQHVNVLRHGFTQREREAQHDLDMTAFKTFCINAMKTMSMSYMGLLAYTGFKLSDAANIVKHLKSVHLGVHCCALGAGVIFAPLITPEVTIFKEVLNRHHITTEDNLGKLVAMREEEAACFRSQFSSEISKYSKKNSNKNYSDDLLSKSKQVKSSEPIERDDGFENFYAKKYDRKTNTYGDELDSD